VISKILSFIILVPLAILLVVFCVANRQDIPVSLDPLGTSPQLAFEAPLFVLLMGAVIVGLLLGGVGTFLTQAHHRARAARRAREIENLRHERDLANDKLRRLREDQARDEASRQAAALPPARTGESLALARPAHAA